MITDYEDDAHFCLKCHQTIIGLDNYVDHRKTGCSKSLINPPKSPLPSQLLPPEEINLKADDFFSSLELRSSSKKPPPQQSQSTSGKNFSGILTRSRISAIQASSSKDNLEPQQSKSGKNLWIGGHQLKELGHGDNQSKLIKAVDNLEKHKDDPPRVEIYEESDEESEEYDYEDENSSSDEDAPPRHHTGGKWKPSSPIQWSRDWNIPPPTYTGGKWKPPPSHTKGKWKPPVEDDNVPPPTFTGSKWVSSKKQLYSNPPPGHTKGKWKPRDEDFPPPSHTKGKWKPREDDFPPPSHTKGKWKPRSHEVEEEEIISSGDKWKPKTSEDSSIAEPSTSKEDHKSDAKEELEPDVNYTRGKWLPSPSKQFVMITEESPLRKSSGTVQYWCSPCNRRLASKVVYDRHLKSELHFKRTLHEGEFDDGAVIKRVKTKPPAMILVDKSNINVNKVDRRRIRKKIFERCGVCQTRVYVYLMGKHLISHYHCRKGDISTELAKNLVLENITSIVWESPFQCSICKFYCNTHDHFLQHWNSEYHKNKDAVRLGYFFCSFCKYKGLGSNEMYEHLTSAEHLEVVSVINRSVPIVIKKINLVECLTCHKQFMLNVQLINHCRKMKHLENKLENMLQNYVTCYDCNSRCPNKISLQRHRRLRHKDQYSFCSPCNLTFSNAAEAKSHRKSLEHRYTCLQKRDSKSALRKCEHCKECFPNFLLLKEHLKTKHPEHKVRCPHCGKTFTITQELGQHIKSKACKFEQNEDVGNNLRCEKCPFTSNSSAELLFHLALHDEPVIIPSLEGNETKKVAPKFSCPICKKLFPKNSLIGHIRIHTQEKPYNCKSCGAKFARRNNLLFHERNHNKKDSIKKKPGEKKEFLCSTCGASFNKKFTLQQHMIIHTGKLCKCPHPGCTYSARKPSEIVAHLQIHADRYDFCCGLCAYKGKTKGQLRRHLTVHDEVKKYNCSYYNCKFSTRTAAHLRRHTRLHTGAKPFSCPHCAHKCNTLENLRKHILSTNKHPGKCIYECKFCSSEKFQTNFAKDFKDHLITNHSDVFTNMSQAASYTAGIYHEQEDCTFADKMNVRNEDAEDETNFVPRVIKIEQNENVLQLKTDEDPIVAQLVTPDLPMFIIPKEGASVAENVSDSWNLVGRYDVEESGALVPFQSDGDTLLQEPF